MSQKNQTRKVYLDVLRVLASFLVCYNHSFGYELFLSPWDSYDGFFWGNTLFNAFTSINIPLFFMISGALLLGREEPYRQILRRRVGHFLLVLTVFSLVIYGIDLPQGAGVGDFLYKFLAGDVNMTYWYLYAYLSLLLMLPFFRKIARTMELRDLLFLFGLRTAFIVLPELVSLALRCSGRPGLSLSYNLQAPLATLGFFFFPLVGYYLAEKLPVEKVEKKHLVWAGAALAAGCVLSAAATYIEHRYLAPSQNFIGLTSFVGASAVFLLVRCACARMAISEKWAARLRGVSGVTVGIYLLEPIVHRYHEKFFSLVPWEPVSVMLMGFAWAIVCMAVGGTATWLLRKIPGVKKIL